MVMSFLETEGMGFKLMRIEGGSEGDCHNKHQRRGFEVSGH